MRNLMITIAIAIATATLSGCATSAANSWVCADGTCLPKMVESYKTASANNVNTIALR